MSIYKVERKVDTVIIEMDISTAEKLQEILFGVVDDSTMKGDLTELRTLLGENAEVRYPSPLYAAVPHDGYFLLKNRNQEEYEKAYLDYHGTLDECEECHGTASRHYLSCSIWGFRK